MGLQVKGRSPALLGIAAILLSLVAPMPAAAAETILYRVNAGGGTISGSPSWASDLKGSPSPYSNALAAGNTTYSTAASIDTSDPSLPSGTPASLFQSERWDDAPAPEMTWTFPVSPGSYQVRLFFAEIFPGTMAMGARTFDVSIEGALVLDNFDVFAAVGANKGIVKTFIVTADSSLQILFGHVVENPAVKGVEISSLGAQPSSLGPSPTTISFGSVTTGQSASQQLTLTNLGGSGDPSITVNATGISGTAASQFGDAFNDAQDVTLSPGASTTFNVTFSPTSTGSKSATLSVTHTGSNSPLTVPLSGTGTTGSIPVGFGKSTLQGETSTNPTTVQFGPDGRLYVGQLDGLIKAYTVARNGTNQYAATATETISTINQVPNHNDNGALNSSITNRLITGMLVVGSASAPVIYVGHSDPRIGAGPDGTDLNLDTNSSMITQLTKSGSSWQKVDLVRGLPRSEENHAVNGMQLDPATNTLYAAMGGNTNKGATSNNFAKLPEFAYSAAILSVDLDAIGNTTYDLPTLDDDSRSGTTDSGDPFGGNDGKNQAKLVAGGPVQIHAPGFRNAYDLVITSAGRMYTIDNGGNAGWGNFPINEGPGGNCTNGINEAGTTDPDSLHFVTGPGYYGGHPNPTRGNSSNTFNSPAQSPILAENGIECDYRAPGIDNGSLTTFPDSTNGIDEYTASNFGGAMTGDLVTAGFDNIVYRVKLNAAGTAVTLKQALFATVGQIPLDVTAQPDAGPFPGTIWVVDNANGAVYVFEPNDFGGGGTACTGADNPALDEDSDGYNNADEIDNGTNPCSAGSVPPDRDGDHISNLNDPDDDNDGSPDTSDPFAIDPANGTTTFLPVNYTWDNDAPDPGGLLNLGFTGLMTNGSSNYESLFDPSQMTAGGAAGVTTVDAVPAGDAHASLNSQQYAFQFGLAVSPATTGVFTARTRLASPFAGIVPTDDQSMGLFIGTGTQNDYLKIVANANGGPGGIEVLKEVGGSATTTSQVAVTLPGPDAVDLYLTVNPGAATVQPSYRITAGGSAGPITAIGPPVAIPTSWVTGSMAIGIISTSNGPGSPFPATWDFIQAMPGPAGASPIVAADTFTRTVSSAWGTADAGGAWSVGPGTAANFSVDGSVGSVVTPASGAEQVATLNATSVRDVDARASFTLPGVPSGPASKGYFGYLLVRKQSSGAYYRIAVFTLPSGTLQIRGQTDSGASLFADVNTGASVSAGEGFTLRIQAVGASPTTLRAKAWRVGTPEPLSWHVTTTSSVAALQQAGSIGVRMLNTTSTGATLKVDNLNATSLGLGQPGGQANVLGASPSSISFPSTVVGQNATQQVTLTNLGQAGAPSITVNSTTISGANAGEFSDTFNDSAGATLAPGASTSFTVRFAPTSAGSKSASLSVAHTGTNTPIVIPLSGTATTPSGQGTWQTRASSQFNRQEVSYVHTPSNGKFYLAGGLSSSRQEAYDPVSNAWADVAPLPATLDHIQGVELGGKIYYLGGLINWPSPATNTVYIYNPATNTFTQGANMPRPRGAGGVAVHNGKIYYAGGLNQGVAVNWFDVYDPAANTWTQLPNMPHARDHFQAAVVGGKFWAIGGRLQAINSIVTYNEAYDLTAGTWQAGLAPLPSTRAGFAVAALGNEIFVIGGEGNGATFSTNEAYNTATNTWRTLAPMPTARHGIEATVCNGGLYIAAGGTIQGGAGPTNVQQVFFPGGTATTCGSGPPPPPPPGTTIAQDAFTRTVSSGWGTAQVGGAWGVVAGTASNFSVNGTTGLISAPSSGAEQIASLGSTSIRDVDATTKITFPAKPSAGAFYGYLVLRRQSSGAYYRVGLFVTNAGTLMIRGQTNAGTALFSDVNTGLAVAAGDTFGIRVQVQGANPTTVRVRAWRAGSAEPSTWAATATSSATGLQQAGALGIRAVIGSGGPAAQLKFDDLLAAAM